MITRFTLGSNGQRFDKARGNLPPLKVVAWRIFLGAPTILFGGFPNAITIFQDKDIVPSAASYAMSL